MKGARKDERKLGAILFSYVAKMDTDGEEGEKRRKHRIQKKRKGRGENWKPYLFS